MLLPAFSWHSVLHSPLRLLQVLRVSAAGSREPLSAFSCARISGVRPLHIAAYRRRSLCKHKSHLLDYVPRPPSRWASSEGQSPDEQLIYTGSLGTAVRGVKAFSYSTSGITLVLLPQIMATTDMSSNSWALQLMIYGVISVFTFITPVLLHLMTRSYVVRLYHNPARDTYTAITYSVFLTEKRTAFHQEQVRIPPVTGMFTTFYADKMGLMVNPEMFSLPHDYNHLMGYDKPFSFNPEQLDES